MGLAEALTQLVALRVLMEEKKALEGLLWRAVEEQRLAAALQR